MFCDALGLVFQVAGPLIPVVGTFLSTLLPPLASLLSLLAGTLLPPITQILTVICNDILAPLMPVISTIAQAILPPVAQLLGLIAPILQLIAPVLQVIGDLLSGIANVVGTLIGWVADGVGAVVNFFDKLFGGAKEATGGMEDLAESTNSVASSIPDLGAIEMPKVEIPDTSAYTSTIRSAMDTTPIVAGESWAAARETANTGLQEIGTNATDTYGAMAEQAESAWTRMSNAAAGAVSSTIAELRRLKTAANDVGTITIGTTGVTNARIPGHARGTSNFEGGLTRINEEGGELAILPGGTQIIPADQTDNLINASRHSKSITFAPQFNIQLSGNPSEEQLQNLEERIMEIARRIFEQLQDEDSSVEALQASLL